MTLRSGTLEPIAGCAASGRIGGTLVDCAVECFAVLVCLGIGSVRGQNRFGAAEPTHDAKDDTAENGEMKRVSMTKV